MRVETQNGASYRGRLPHYRTPGSIYHVRNAEAEVQEESENYGENAETPAPAQRTGPHDH